MALSGSFSKYPVSGFGLYCTWSATQSVTGNYSDVTLNVYLKYYTLEVGSRADSVVSINGTSETYTTAAINDYSSGQHTKLLKTKTVRVAHNSNGTKTGVALSASWRFDGKYSGTSIGTITASASIDLNAIDRSAPTVSCSVSNITASGFTISATSSATADNWQYSTNNGSTFATLSTTEGTSASKAITGLSPNTTYKVIVKARKKSNQVSALSSAVSAKTLGGAVVNSVSQVTADAATVSIKLNVTVYEASYVNTLEIRNGNTTILTLSGLSWSKGTADRTLNLTSSERTTLLNAMASSKSIAGTFVVTSYSGSTQIGNESSYKATITTTAANSAPTMSAFTYKDNTSTTSTLTGNDQLLVQNQSSLVVTPSAATAKNGASVVSYSATCNGVTVSNTTGAALTVGKVSKSGNITVTVTATDSRGYTVSQSKTITVIAYESPKISSITLRRTNDIEAEMQLIFSGSISAVSVSGAQKNALTYARYRYKKTSETNYTGYVSILSNVTKSGTSFSFSDLELCDLSANASYDFHLQIVDKLGTSAALNLYYVIPQGTPLVALRKQMVGINTPSPEAALHVVGDAKISGAVTATSLSGSLAASKITGSLPIAHGGTGATTAAAARTNLAVLPLAGGTLTGQVKNTYDNQGGFLIEHGEAKDACFKATRTDTGTSVYLGVGAGGTNHGVYSLSLNKWMIYGNASEVKVNGTAENVTGTVAVGHGGTGATTAAAARTNLGIACTSLYSGTLTTGTATFNYGSYKAYIIIGQPASASARVAIVIPKAILTTSEVSYQIADEVNYYSFKLSYSGTVVTLAYSARSSSGQILRVFGIN